MHHFPVRFPFLLLAGLLASAAQAAPACLGLDDCMVKGSNAADGASAASFYVQGLATAPANTPKAQLALANVILGQTYIQLYGQSNGEQAQYLDLAEKAFNQSLAQLPDDFSAYAGLGIIAANRGSREKALEWMGKGIAADSKDPMAWVERGNFYMNTDQFEKAAADFSSAIDLLPGKAYDAEKKIHFMKVGVNLPPMEQAMIYIRRAQAYAQLGKKAEYNADLDRACELGDKRACS